MFYLILLVVFSCGMTAGVISLRRRNKQLTQELYFTRAEKHLLDVEFHELLDGVDIAYDERQRLIRLVWERTLQRDDAHKMLEVVLKRDLENNETPKNLGVEVGRAGIYYKFTYKDGDVVLNENSIILPDEESEVASRDSPQQAPEEREDLLE